MAGTGEGGSRTPLRVHCFEGQLLTARDFQDEQRYHMAKHRLHNRLFHGWGIVDGLGVAASEGTTVRVGAGYAIDRHGREIDVPDPLRVDVAQPTDDEGRQEGDPLDTGLVRLRLLYREIGVEPRPVPGEEEPVHARIAETFRLLVRTDPRGGDEGVILAAIRLEGNSIAEVRPGRRHYPGATPRD